MRDGEGWPYARQPLAHSRHSISANGLTVRCSKVLMSGQRLGTEDPMLKVGHWSGGPEGRAGPQGHQAVTSYTWPSQELGPSPPGPPPPGPSPC